MHQSLSGSIYYWCVSVYLFISSSVCISIRMSVCYLICTFSLLFSLSLSCSLFFCLSFSLSLTLSHSSFLFLSLSLSLSLSPLKVFFASAAPPVRFSNVYGIDIPTRTELIAHNRTEADIGTSLKDYLYTSIPPQLPPSHPIFLY